MNSELNEGKCQEREKQVNEQVSKISKLADQADVLTNHLYARLEVVLRQEPETASPDNDKEPAALVALAYDLKCKADQIENHNMRIEDILNRMEI